MFIYYLLFIRHATFSEYVIYSAEQFVFSEVICGEEGERTSEFIVFPLLLYKLTPIFPFKEYITFYIVNGKKVVPVYNAVKETR